MNLSGTFQELHFIREHGVSEMQRVLYIYACLNREVQYVQGMNELFAPLYFIFLSSDNYVQGGQDTKGGAGAARAMTRKSGCTAANWVASVAAAASPVATAASMRRASTSNLRGDNQVTCDRGAPPPAACRRRGRAMALLTMALLTMALLTMALLTMALLTMALLTTAV